MGQAIGLVVAFAQRRAGAVVAAGVLAALFAIWFAAGHLGISTDMSLMFSPELPYRQRAVLLEQAFPQFRICWWRSSMRHLPEQAEATAAALADALAADTAHFRTVRRPDALPWLHREGSCSCRRTGLPMCWTAPSMPNRSSAGWPPIRARADCSAPSRCWRPGWKTAG